jgi:hypothetical protein
MPTYADFSGWVISTIAGWFVVNAGGQELTRVCLRPVARLRRRLSGPDPGIVKKGPLVHQPRVILLDERNKFYLSALRMEDTQDR